MTMGNYRLQPGTLTTRAGMCSSVVFSISQAQNVLVLDSLTKITNHE